MHVQLRALRAGAKAYFTVPTKANELVGKIDYLTGGAVSLPPDRVLVIDDSSVVAAFFADVLGEAGMLTRTVSDPMQALAAIREFSPSLIILDWHMPECSGDELIRLIRQRDELLGVPIVVVSGEIDESVHMRAMRHGASDFLRKPVEPEVLLERVLAHLERHRALVRQMTKDGLTGLLNNASLRDAIDGEVRRARRSGRACCLAVIDLDHFKQINDTYGHEAGDVVLRNVSRLLLSRLRQTDIAGRYGGEEFCVLLPDTPLDTAATLLDRLRREFSAIEHRCGRHAFKVSFSAGIAVSEFDDPRESIFSRADQILYQAKRAGRNRVHLELAPDGGTLKSQPYVAAE
jgi:diguanylate cyclase (GGDEF)-like protein